MARKAGRDDGRGALHAYLTGLRPEVLVDLLLDHADEDSLFTAHLAVLASAEGAPEPTLSALRHAFDDAVEVYDVVSYREAWGYAEGIDEAVDDIAALLDAGRPEAVIELCEHALACVERAIEHVDDSDGCMSGLLERLQELHLSACLAARPDPVALAERLFAREMATEWGTFYDAAVTYAPVLGADGLATYRRLAEARWADVPTRTPSDGGGGYEPHRARITRIMENLAEIAGDLDALVAIKGRDLSSAWNFLKIAALLRERGRADDALAWAERGAAAFPERADPRLRTFLAEEYSRCGRGDEAADMAWANFVDRPVLDTYEALHGFTSPGGGWREWRARALDVLTADAKPDGSRLVQVYLWEGDVEAAWRAAGEFGCSRSLWLDLAEGREGDHPGDAVTVYVRMVEPTIGHKNNRAYAEAVALLRRVATLEGRMGRDAEFAAYVRAVRAAHKPKRNLMKLFDAEGWR